MPELDTPDLAFSLDVRSLRTWIVIEEGDPVLHLSDDDQHVVVEPGAGGSADDALDGARRLADLAQQYLGLLERRPREWWTPPEIVTAEQLTKP